MSGALDRVLGRGAGGRPVPVTIIGMVNDPARGLQVVGVLPSAPGVAAGASGWRPGVPIGAARDQGPPTARPGWDGTDSSARVWDAVDARTAAQPGASPGCLGPFLEFLDRSAAALHPQVQCTIYLKLVAANMLLISVVWLANYLFHVLPRIDESWPASCAYNNNQLLNTARLLFFYFTWFACARIILFVPRVASRFTQITARSHGYCRAYCMHLLLRDGPLYIFVLGSLLFWFHLLPSSLCQQSSPKFYRALRLYAMYNNLLGVICLLVAFWHNRLLLEGDRLGEELQAVSRGAPPGTLEKFETLSYDVNVFGDEDGKKYPSDCAICLGTWEPDDVIKVTPCGHAFHEECVGHWLKAARTCALCRQDVTGAAARQVAVGEPVAVVVAPGGAPGVVPAPQTLGTAGRASPQSFGAQLEDA